MKPDAPLPAPEQHPTVTDRPADAVIAELEHGFDAEGAKPVRSPWRPSVLVISLIVGGLLAIGATLFEIF